MYLFILSRRDETVNNLVCVISLTYDNGYYWTEVHIPWLTLLLEEAACIIDYRLVVDNRSLDYNPEENLKMIKMNKDMRRC